jgi:hypothetical protein
MDKWEYLQQIARADTNINRHAGVLLGKSIKEKQKEVKHASRPIFGKIEGARRILLMAING